jgi:16S rRNA (adenine1518-N6/adenine1519-N6)-dimethyltransferase
MARLEEMGLQPKKSLGQNFLVSEHAIQKIISTLPSDCSTPVVEIGPGPGALTEGILKNGAPLTVIELDRKAAQYWRSRGVNVLEEDALKVDYTQFSEGAFLISNLPYQISASLVLELSVSAFAFSKMTLMFQKEVAQRIMALPKTSNYGMLSVIAQNFWQISKLMDLAPQAFYPSPKVASRVLQFRRSPVDMSVEERTKYLHFVKGCFHQKRKKLANNLKGLGDEGFAARAMDFLQEKGKSESIRAEELSPREFLELYELMNASYG